MPESVLAAALVFAAGMTGLAFGVSGHAVMHAAPAAFKRLDYTRADALVRRILKGALPWIAGFAGGAALFAIVGSAFGAAVMLALAATGVLIARYALNPLPKRPRVPGQRRRLKQTRIAALWATGVMSMLFPVALIALAFGV